MKLYRVSGPQCDCEADATFESTVERVVRGKPSTLNVAKKIHHYRKRDQANFWHWSDQEVIRI